MVSRSPSERMTEQVLVAIFSETLLSISTLLERNQLGCEFHFSRSQSTFPRILKDNCR